MAYLKDNRLIFTTHEDYWVSVHVDFVYKAYGDAKLFSHGHESPWTIKREEVSIMDSILFPDED
jgi:hypothetical protein